MNSCKFNHEGICYNCGSPQFKRKCETSCCKCSLPTTNYEHIRNMSIEEMAMFLMKVNNSYAVDCMYHESECKHPNVDNNCAICFKEWLESDVEGGDGE